MNALDDLVQNTEQLITSAAYAGDNYDTSWCATPCGGVSRTAHNLSLLQPIAELLTRLIPEEDGSYPLWIECGLHAGLLLEMLPQFISASPTTLFHATVGELTHGRRYIGNVMNTVVVVNPRLRANTIHVGVARKFGVVEVLL